MTAKRKLAIDSEANFEKEASDDPPENKASKIETPIYENNGNDEENEWKGKYGNDPSSSIHHVFFGPKPKDSKSN